MIPETALSDCISLRDPARLDHQEGVEIVFQTTVITHHPISNPPSRLHNQTRNLHKGVEKSFKLHADNPPPEHLVGHP